MTLEDYQADLRRSYVGGGPGTIVSGLVWAVAAIVFSQSGLEAGFAALFFGGMVIFPLIMLVSRTLFGRAGVMAGNTGGRIVVETLPMMFVGLFVAWLLMASQPGLVFPIAAMAVGARYFNFRTAYGDGICFLLGGPMVAVRAVAAMGCSDRARRRPWLCELRGTRLWQRRAVKGRSGGLLAPGAA